MKQFIRLKLEVRNYKPYKSIEFCPFWNFFKVLETKDARYILKLKDYEKLPVTLNTWENEFNELSYQYSDAYDTIKSQLQRAKTQKLQEIRLKMCILSNCITILSIQYDTELLEIVSTYYPKVVGMAREQAINYLVSQFKGLKTQYNLKSFEPYQHESKEIDMYEIINAIEQYKGYGLDPHTLTVKKFIAMQKNFEKWAAAKQQQNGRR